MDLKNKERKSKNALETLKKERDDLLLDANRVDLLDTEVEKLRSENLEKIDEIDELKKGNTPEVITLKENLAKEIDTLKVQKEEFEGKLVKVNQLIEKQDELNDLFEQDKALGQAIDDLNTKITELKRQIHVKKAHEQNKTNEISHLNADLEKEENELKNLLNEKFEKEKKIEEKRGLYQGTKEEIDGLEKDQKDYEVLLKKAKKEKDDIERLVSGQKESLQYLEDQIQKTNHKIVPELLSKKSDATKELEILNSQCSELLDTVTDLQKKIETEKNRSKLLLSENEQKNSEFLSLKNNNSTLQESLLLLVDEVSKFEKSVQEKTNEITIQKELADKFEEQVKTLELEVNEIKAKHEMMNIQFRKFTEQKEANSVVDDLCKLISEGRAKDFKNLFDSIQIENSDIGRKCLIVVIQPIFNALGSIDFKHKSYICSIFEHIVKSKIFVDSFIFACEDNNCKEEICSIFSNIGKLRYKVSSADRDKFVNINGEFYKSLFTKFSNKKVPYFIFNFMAQQIDYSFLIKDLDALICSTSLEFKQQYFNDCLENLHDRYKNKTTSLIFSEDSRQINFLLNLLGTRDSYFNNYDNSIVFSKDQLYSVLESTLKFPSALFEGMVNYMDKKSPDKLCEYLGALEYNESNIGSNALKIIRDMTQKHNIQKNDNISSMNENQTLNVAQNQICLIDKLSSTKEDSDIQKNNTKQSENQIKTTSQKIEIVEIKEKNNNLPQIQNNNVINESKQIQINSIEEKKVAKIPEIWNVQDLIDLIKKDKKVAFCGSFDSVGVYNDEQKGYVEFVILPILSCLIDCKAVPGEYLEHVLKSEEFLNSFSGVIKNDQEDRIVNDFFNMVQSIMKRKFHDKKNIIKKFHKSLLEKIKYDKKIPFLVLKNIKQETNFSEAKDVFEKLICGMPAELKQLYFDECLDNLCNYKNNNELTLLFETSEDQIQFLQCLCNDYGSDFTNDMITEQKNQGKQNIALLDNKFKKEEEFSAQGSMVLHSVDLNPRTLSFSKEQFQNMVHFPILFTTIKNYMQRNCPERIGEYCESLQYDSYNIDKDVLQTIRKYTIPKKLLMNKKEKQWYGALKDANSALYDYGTNFEFIYFMTPLQFLQYARFQVSHFIKKKESTIDEQVHRNGYYIVGQAQTLFNQMRIHDFLRNAKNHDNFMLIKNQLKFTAMSDPVVFFLLAFRTKFCFYYCENRQGSDSCGVKLWLKEFFEEPQITKFFAEIWSLYDAVRPKEYRDLKSFLQQGKIEKLFKNNTNNSCKLFKLMQKIPLDTKYKARFYQLCFDWVCENKELSHEDFIKYSHKIWHVAKNSSNKSDQMTRDGEMLKIKNCAKDTYYRPMFDLQGFDQEKSMHQTRQERLRAIQKYNLDPICSIDEAATYINGFSKKPDAVGLLGN